MRYTGAIRLEQARRQGFGAHHRPAKKSEGLWGYSEVDAAANTVKKHRKDLKKYMSTRWREMKAAYTTGTL